MVRWVFSTVPTFNQCVDTGDRAYFGRKTLFGVAAVAALRCDASDGRPGGQAALRRSQPEILGQPAGGHGRRGGAGGLSCGRPSVQGGHAGFPLNQPQMSSSSLPTVTAADIPQIHRSSQAYAVAPKAQCLKNSHKCSISRPRPGPDPGICVRGRSLSVPRSPGGAR